MDDDTKNALIRLGAVAALVFMQWVAYDQSAKITLKAWGMKLRAAWRDAREGYEAGEKVAEWFVQAEYPAVLAEAERIKREEAL